jgi:hypothetical protein
VCVIEIYISIQKKEKERGVRGGCALEREGERDKSLGYLDTVAHDCADKDHVQYPDVHAPSFSIDPALDPVWVEVFRQQVRL